MYFAFCGNVQDRSKDTPGPRSQRAPWKESSAGDGAASGEGAASGRGQLGISPTLRHPHSDPHPGLYQTSPQRAQDQGWGVCSWICAHSFRLSTGCFWPRCLLCSPQTPWVLRETALTSRSAELQAWRTRSRCWDSPSLSATPHRPAVGRDPRAAPDGSRGTEPRRTAVSPQAGSARPRPPGRQPAPAREPHTSPPRGTRGPDAGPTLGGKEPDSIWAE